MAVAPVVQVLLESVVQAVNAHTVAVAVAEATTAAVAVAVIMTLQVLTVAVAVADPVMLIQLSQQVPLIHKVGVQAMVRLSYLGQEVHLVLRHELRSQ